MIFGEGDKIKKERKSERERGDKNQMSGR